MSIIESKDGQLNEFGSRQQAIPQAAIPLQEIAGTWDMVHDGWRGTLVIGVGTILKSIDGPCTFTSMTIDGTYTGGDRVAHQVKGHFGGKDDNRRTTEQCKASDHHIMFTIAAPSGLPQPFEGYMFSRERRTLAGFTWWQGIPFAWYAMKR